jgi:hypothetical protein
MTRVGRAIATPTKINADKNANKKEGVEMPPLL